jgi:hypothetical protein
MHHSRFCSFHRASSLLCSGNIAASSTIIETALALTSVVIVSAEVVLHLAIIHHLTLLFRGYISQLCLAQERHISINSRLLADEDVLSGCNITPSAETCWYVPQDGSRILSNQCQSLTLLRSVVVHCVCS